MIRIRTKFEEGGKTGRVLTLFFEGSWVTIVTGADTMDTDSFREAGANHLQAAAALREKIIPCKTWEDRAARQGGFIDDDMGCGDEWSND